MIPIHIDFETRSAVDLRKATAHAYAEDASTDAWCMAYAIADREVKLWKMGDPFPEGLGWALKANDTYFVAHNAAFEYVIWNEIMHKRHGWPELPLSRLHCTMAMAYAMSLPGSLENAALAAGLDVGKDMEGRRLMLKMAKPRSTTPDGRYIWWDEPANRERLYEYCKNDITVERELGKRLLPLKPRERAVWLTDQLINNRGVPVDIESIRKAIRTVDSEKMRLDRSMGEATEGYVSSTRSIQDLSDFASTITMTKGIDGLAKADIKAALTRDDIPTSLREALLIRQEGAKSSTAKLDAMLDGASRDNRVRGILQYHGAGTGRWAGRKLQPQNFPRPNLDQASIEDAIAHIDDADYLSAMYGKPMQVISDCLRGMIQAKEGYDLIAADYANIEGRVLAWLAGEEGKLTSFRNFDNGVGADIYLIAASLIYGLPKIEEAKPFRQVGKTAELALGYQGGVGAFQTMARSFGIDMSQALEGLVDRASEKQLDTSFMLWSRYSDKNANANIDVSGEYRSFMASDLTKQFWRANHPATVQYWYDLDQAAKLAVRSKGEIFCAGPNDHREVRFKQSGSFLLMRLPSGRNICYPFPKIKELPPPWADDDSDETRPTLTYMGVDPVTKTWCPQKAYGGMLAENATQGVARDILVEGMFNVEDAGSEESLDVIFHVHDEIVAQVKSDRWLSPEFFSRLIIPDETRVPWIAGCPIAAEGWRGVRYRK
jgi:DNA polymerase bacteriophage-type